MLRTLNSDHLQVVEGSKRLALSALVTVNRFRALHLRDRYSILQVFL